MGDGEILCANCGKWYPGQLEKCPVCNVDPVTGQLVATDRATHEASTAPLAIFCRVAGMALMVIGAYFLLIDPSEGSAFGRDLVNFHRLTLGQTAAIVGAVLFGAGARSP